MEDRKDWKAYFADAPETLEALEAWVLRERQLLIDQAVSNGEPVSARDVRVRIRGVRAAPRGERDGIPDGMVRLPLSFESDVVLDTGVMTGLEQRISQRLYDLTKARILHLFPEMEDEALAEGLMRLVPHVAKIVACVWHEETVLMKLAYRYEAPEPVCGRLCNARAKILPSTEIGFPQGVVFPAAGKDFDDRFHDLADESFMMFQIAHDFRHDTSWSVILPDRPEVLCVRHTQFVGDPSAYFRGWQEEGVYPHLFVAAEDIASAADDDTASLKRAIEEAHAVYDRASRSLDKKVRVDAVCGQCKQPTKYTLLEFKPPRMLNYDPSLALDAITREVVQQSIFQAHRIGFDMIGDGDPFTENALAWAEAKKDGAAVPDGVDAFVEAIEEDTEESGD